MKRKQPVGAQATSRRPPVLIKGGAKKHTGKTRPQAHPFIASMLEHLPNMVFVKDAQHLRFVHLNEAGEQLLGYSRLELLGKNDHDLFPKAEADFFTAKDRDVLASGRLLDIPEEHIQTRHKGVRLLHTKKVPICDAGGRPRYLLGISEDITERKAAEKILQRAYAALEERVMERTAELVEANTALHDLSGRLINAQEEERSRIARDLHDDVCQQLALTAIALEDLGQRPPTSGPELSSRCRELSRKTREVSAALHRLSHELHPSKLDHLGLEVAVRSFCRDITRLHHVTVAYQCQGMPDSLPKAMALCLYRVTQEALHNVAKHSGARHATVELAGHAGMIRIRISDAGAGFDPNKSEAKAGLGITSMRERVRRIGGTLSIHSVPLRGTTIEVEAPLPASYPSSYSEEPQLCIAPKS